LGQDEGCSIIDSMKAIVVILLLALLFISQLNTILDIDLWWNLKTGEHIVKNLEIPRTDLFSYTLKEAYWIDHEWLSQIFFYAIFSKFGWLGLNIFKAFTICLCFFILLFLIHSKYKKNFFAILFSLLAVLAFGYRSFLRPELFSYLFLCIFFYILEKEKRIYLLPFLQIIWVNLHGYFILGPALSVLYCIGEFVSGNKDRSKKLAILSFWIMLACFVNPYFYKGALYPLRILTDVFTEQKLYMQHIHELMMPIRSSFGRYGFLWIFTIATSATFIINLKKAKPKHIILFVASFFAAYSAVRNIPIFIFVGLPIASINLNESGLAKKMPEKKLYFLAAAVTGFLIYFFLSNKYYVFTNQYAMRKTESKFSGLFMPEGACDFLEKNNISGRMFNTLDFGPYIGYRFYPERRIFIDTRTDLYKDEFYSIYRRARDYPEDWQDIQRKYRFEIVLLRHLFRDTERLMRYLHMSKDWKLVYYDANSCIFLKNTDRNSRFIDRFKLDLSQKEITETDVNFHVARFFEKIGEVGLAESIYKALR